MNEKTAAGVFIGRQTAIKLMNYVSYELDPLLQQQTWEQLDRYSPASKRLARWMLKPYGSRLTWFIQPVTQVE